MKIDAEYLQGAWKVAEDEALRVARLEGELTSAEVSLRKL